MRWSMDPKLLITIFLCAAAERAAHSLLPGKRGSPSTSYTLGTDATTPSFRSAASRWRLSVDWSSACPMCHLRPG